MISFPEKGPRGSEDVHEQEKIPEISKELPNVMADPKDRGEKDRKETEKFMHDAMSDAVLKIFEGKDPGALLDVVSRHDKEFAPDKMAEIENDAKKYVARLPDALRDAL